MVATWDIRFIAAEKLQHKPHKQKLVQFWDATGGSPPNANQPPGGNAGWWSERWSERRMNGGKRALRCIGYNQAEGIENNNHPDYMENAETAMD